MIRTALVSILALVGPAHLATAEIITVCASGCDYTSINAAIAAASDGDVIQLSAETYFEGEQIDTLGKAITLRGVLDKAGKPASVLDGQASHRILICENGENSDTVFENLVIQHGLANGGGMRNSASSPTLVNCTFAGNSAPYGGGGMSNYLSSPTLTDCTFKDNSANDYGGAMLNTSSSPAVTNCMFRGQSAGRRGGAMCNFESNPAVTACTFVGNSADEGGGMYNNESTPALDDCTFVGNIGQANGGGMRNYKSSPTLTDCVFRINFATRGGGMYNFESTPVLDGCQFEGNEAGLGGGGMGNEASSLILTGCTFVGNEAGFRGYAMENLNGSGPRLTGCEFTECCQVDPPRSFVDLGGNKYESWCDECRENIDCRNNSVDAEDLGYLLARWGTDDPQSDIDGDGLVTASDLGFLFAAWGPCQ